MKVLKQLITLFFTMLVISVAPIASAASAQGAVEYVDDAAITAKVKAAILAEPSLKSSDIKVETEKGTVHLSGAVGSEEEQKKAADVAVAVKGVSSVKNDLVLK